MLFTTLKPITAALSDIRIHCDASSSELHTDNIMPMPSGPLIQRFLGGLDSGIHAGLQLIPEDQKAALLKQLTAPRPLDKGVAGSSQSLEAVAARAGKHIPVLSPSRKSPILSIAPLTIAPAPTKPA